MDKPIGTFRAGSDNAIVDAELVVTFHIDGMPDVVETLPLLAFKDDEVGWYGIMGIVFPTLSEGDSVADVFTKVRNALTVEVKERVEGEGDDDE